MILIGFSLLDIKTGIFNAPFFMSHAGQAIRACTDLGQDTNTTVGRHPADFQLCQLGTFDDQTGMFTMTPPMPLGTVAGFLPTKPMTGSLFEPSHVTEGNLAHPPGWAPSFSNGKAE